MTWIVWENTFDGWFHSMKPLGQVEAHGRNDAYRAARGKFPLSRSLSIDPKAPTNARELLAYLREHPRVRTSCDDPRVPVGDLTFARHADGGLWFATPEGPEQYTPIDCGMTRHETGLAFRPDGFDVTKFGVTIRFDYLD